MDGNWQIAAFIFGAVSIGMIAAGWSQFLEHKRRSQAMDVIKVALQAGKEPPPIVYEQLSKAGDGKAPWSEVVLFGALGFGFWIAFAQSDGDQRTAFLVIAATMTVTSLGCLGLALMHPGSRRGGDDKR